LPVGEPLPSVPAPPEPPACGGLLPPLSTVLLAEMIAWRKGCTPKETLATTAIAASTPTGRSQPTSHRPTPPPDPARSGISSSPGPGSRFNRGNGNDVSDGSCDTRVSSTRGSDIRGSRSSAGAGSAAGQAQLQCPRQTQLLARSAASAATLSSHGRGALVAILARIRSSPSSLTSNWLTWSASARLSASSMRSSGAIMPPPARRGRSWS